MSQAAVYIKTNTTWNSNHTVSDDTYVCDGATLSIAGGVTVSFDAGKSLYIGDRGAGKCTSDAGTLVAASNNAGPVYFKANTTPGSPGYWGAIVLTSDSSNNVLYKVRVENGGGTIIDSYDDYNMVQVLNGSTDISESIFRYSGGVGILFGVATGSTLSTSTVIYTDADAVMVASGGSADIDQTCMAYAANDEEGFHMESGADYATMTESRVFGNDRYGIAIDDGDFTMSYSYIYENDIVGVYLVGGWVDMNNNRIEDNCTDSMRWDSNGDLTLEDWYSGLWIEGIDTLVGEYDITSNCIFSNHPTGSGNYFDILNISGQDFDASYSWWDNAEDDPAVIETNELYDEADTYGEGDVDPADAIGEACPITTESGLLSSCLPASW